MGMILKFCILASLFISKTSVGMISINKDSLLGPSERYKIPKKTELIYFSVTKTIGAINIIIDSNIKNKRDNLIEINSWKQKVIDSVRYCACDVSIRFNNINSVKDIGKFNSELKLGDVYVDFNHDFYISNDKSQTAEKLFNNFHAAIWQNRTLTGVRKERKERIAREKEERRETQIEERAGRERERYKGEIEKRKNERELVRQQIEREENAWAKADQKTRERILERQWEIQKRETEEMKRAWEIADRAAIEARKEMEKREIEEREKRERKERERAAWEAKMTDWEAIAKAKINGQKPYDFYNDDNGKFIMGCQGRFWCPKGKDDN